MTEATTKTRAPRRSAEQLAAEAQARANALRAKAGKAKREIETRQKVIVGAALIGLADAGDAEAIRLLDRIKGGLTRWQDRQAFGLGEIAVPDPADPNALAARIKVMLDAYSALPESDRVGRSEAAKAWRVAVIEWERNTGKFWVAEDKRKKHGLGGLGELAS